MNVIEVRSVSKDYRLGGVERGRILRAALKGLGLGRRQQSAQLGYSGPGQLESSGQSPRFKALDDVSFDVAEGDVLGIVGKNGAGKSTLLKILSRVTSPSAGKVRIRGRVASLLEVGTGFHPELTGRENIYLNAAILGMSRKEVASKLDDIIDFSELSKFIDTPVKRYSSGMYVRLAFSVAAHLQSDILILDEVLAVGDAAFQRKCLGKVEDIRENGRTVLFVSHNMGLIQSLCNRAILIEKGRVTFDGSPSKAIDIYVRSGAEVNEATVRFDGNEHSPISIERLTLRDSDGNPTSTFGFNQPIEIEMEYLVREPLRNSMIQLAISKTGIFVFQTHDNDLEPGLLVDRRQGRFVSKVTIPERFLTPGEYFITASGSVGATGEFGRDCHTNALRFEVLESGDDLTFKSYSPVRGMLVAKELPWRTQCLER